MAYKENNTDEEITAGSHLSYWTDSVEPASFQNLKEDVSTDVVIVGAGISGLSIAYHLLNSGKSVVVVEDGLIGSGESGRTTAHLANAIDDRYYEVERIFGADGARLAAESHTKAINVIETTIRQEGIDCDFKRVSGYLFADPSDKEDSLKKELDAAQKAGVQVNWLDKIPHIKQGNKPCLEFMNQAQFHPMKYLNALAEIIQKKGGSIYIQTRAEEISSEGIVTRDGHKVSAKHVVVATNSPVNNKYVMHLKQYPYRSYVIGATIEKGTVPYALWWDTGNHDADSDIAPYHYVRLQEYNDQYDLMIVGGEDHPTGMPEAYDKKETDSYGRLESWTREQFPIVDIVYKWSGQVFEPMDALAYIGRNPMDKNNVYIVTGDSGNGMTHGTIAGLLITDLINGKENPWEKIYSPSRTNFLKAGGVFLRQFFGGMLQYLKYSRKDAKNADGKLADIHNGDAKIIELDKDKYGAYKDENGNLHLVSATCTHAGCTIRWNGDEKSWDCPCHGSRFTYEGKVMNGPAKEDLVYIQEPAENLAST